MIRTKVSFGSFSNLGLGCSYIAGVANGAAERCLNGVYDSRHGNFIVGLRAHKMILKRLKIT